MKRKSLFLNTFFILTLLFLTSCDYMYNEDYVSNKQIEEQSQNNNNDENDINSDRVVEPEESVDEHDEEIEEALSLPAVSLQKKDQTEDVTLLQEVLIEIGYHIDSSGIFDDHTVWAITDFQLQHDDLYITGVYNYDTKEALNRTLDKEEEIQPGKALEKPSLDQENEPIKLIENPYEILTLVNKHHAFPSDFIPIDLTIPDVRFPFAEDLPKKQLRQVAADALEKLFEAGDKANVQLFAQSGYRSYARQEVLFASYVENHGEKAANNFSARPGESEHQSGLTMDVTSPDIDFLLNTDFAETDEGKWLEDHASDFGYIIRYPKEKEAITEYQYEPWHIRYVGEKAAKEIMKYNLTLEEYLEKE